MKSYDRIRLITTSSLTMTSFQFFIFTRKQLGYPVMLIPACVHTCICKVTFPFGTYYMQLPYTVEQTKGIPLIFHFFFRLLLDRFFLKFVFFNVINRDKIGSICNDKLVATIMAKIIKNWNTSCVYNVPY